MYSMENDKTIQIKNIYYMFAYACKDMYFHKFDKILTESFENVLDLFAAILQTCLEPLCKRGLYRDYRERQEDLSTLRGKVDIDASMALKMRREQKLCCSYDELSADNEYNRIIKTAARIIIASRDVKLKTREKLKRQMLIFQGIGTVEPDKINWSQIRFQRQNGSYRILMHVCNFIFSSLLLTTDEGEHYLAAFLDEQEYSRLFEKFVLGYYRKHYPALHASPAKIDWDVHSGDTRFLPKMQTDITLRQEDKTLIIDTKYYKKIYQNQSIFDRKSIRSQHLYQIYSYVKNKDISGEGKVSGMLLYAAVEGEDLPDEFVNIGGNDFYIKTLDLNQEFEKIQGQLDGIVSQFTAHFRTHMH